MPDDPTVELAAALGDRATLVNPGGVDHVGWPDADRAAYRSRLRRSIDRAVAP